MFLLCTEGVARHFFSQQLISTLAKGGCDGPNGSEGLTASQDSVCVCVSVCVLQVCVCVCVTGVCV